MKEEPADEIERVMKADKVSPADLERRGIPASVTSRLLNEVCSPTWKTIQSIAKALGYRAYLVFRKKGNKDGD